MKVVILAGGFGTRLSEYTDRIPKPMALIGGKPILWHVMNIFSKHGHKDFIVACGYKSEVIKDYFLNYKNINADFKIDLDSGSKEILTEDNLDWKVTLVDTGIDTLTGGRVKRLERYIENERFMLTYGDGLTDLNINDLLSFHQKHNKIATVTAVRPSARFGELNIDDGKVINFEEKPQIGEGWINGGFFVMEPEFLEYIDGDDSILERDPLETVTKKGELMEYKHHGFWQCMDTKRDLDLLNDLYKEKNHSW